MADMPSVKPRRWFVLRYSLRTLLIVMTVACLVSGFWLNRAFRHRDAVRRFKQLTMNRSQFWGVAVGYRSTGDALYDSPATPAWLQPLRTALGEEAFGEVIAVDLTVTTATDNDLRHLAAVPTVESLSLSNTRVTDNGLPHLHACPKLKFLAAAAVRCSAWFGVPWLAAHHPLGYAYRFQSCSKLTSSSNLWLRSLFPFSAS